MEKFAKWFVGEESGQSMVEYGLIIGLVAVVLIGALATVGGKDGLDGMYKQTIIYELTRILVGA